MALTVHIWEPACESKPKGLFNRERFPNTPLGWFWEEPNYAAELFVLEIKPIISHAEKMTRTINVEDEIGQLHVFQVTVCWDIIATAKRMNP